MSSDTNARHHISTADALIGISTLLVLAVDVVVLVIMLANAWATRWDSVYDAATVHIFLLAILIAGLGAGGGIVLKSFGVEAQIAGRWPPLAIVMARVGLLMSTWPLAVLQQEGRIPGAGWDSALLMTVQYLGPTTVLLLLLAVVGVLRRSKAA